MEKIRFYNSITEADLASKVLRESGVESIVDKKGVKFSGDMGDSYGADLLVSEKDVDVARGILEVFEK